MTIKFLLDQDTQREAWLAQKQTCLSGTEVAAILGLHPYKTGYQVWKDKLGCGEEVVVTDRMEWGNRLEPVLGKKYEDLHNVKLTKGGFLKHPEYPWYGGSLDYVLELGEKEKPLVVECKTTDAWLADMWGDPTKGHSGVPVHYRIQGVWYQPLIDAQATDFPVLIGGNSYLEFRAYRDQNLLDALMEEALAWWNRYIVNGHDHPKDGSDTCKRDLAKKFRGDSLEIVQATPDQDEMVRQLARIMVDQKALEASRDLIENKLREEIGTNYGMKGGTAWKLTWSGRGKESKSISYKKVVDELHPDLEAIADTLAKHTKVSIAGGTLNKSGVLFKGGEGESSSNVA